MKDPLPATPGAAIDAVLAKLCRALAAHPVFQALEVPKAFARTMGSRTQGGGRCGDHSDNAPMGETRADLSFTVFLSRPDSYEGGELTISDRVEDRRFKLAQGEVIVYPSDTVHRVEPVTAGSRRVGVCWVQS